MNLNIWSLKWRIFLLFIGLGFLVFFSTALSILVRDGSRFASSTYANTLETALSMLSLHTQIDNETISHLMEDDDGRLDAVHFEAVTYLREVAAVFGLSRVYLLLQRGDMTVIVMSNSSTPGYQKETEWNGGFSPEIDGAFSSGEPVFTGKYETETGSLVSAFKPVTGEGKVLAVWGADLSPMYVPSLFQHTIGTLIFTFIVSSVIAALFAFFISSSLTRPIYEIEKVAMTLATMNFEVRIDASRKDELGRVQKALVRIRDSLKENFTLFGESASKVSTAVYDLSSSAREITTTANEQSTTVAEIVSTMEGNKNLSEQVSEKTMEVAELAVQTEHLSQHGAELHDANEKMMGEIRNQNSKVVDEINNLTDVLSRIDESVHFIDTIADRTKLIAFNAALEASSAGEAGLRFAVVAGEIRRFADNVGESVAEIKERIIELQDASGSLIAESGIGSDAIDSGYKRMVEQKEVFESIVDVSQNVAVRSQQISNLSKQQELASEQIFTALKEISAGVKQFVVATSSTSVTADNLRKMSLDLEEKIVRYQHDGTGDV
jgi:methyl-accepting chemotaxis protein